MRWLEHSLNISLFRLKREKEQRVHRNWCIMVNWVVKLSEEDSVQRRVVHIARGHWVKMMKWIISASGKQTSSKNAHDLTAPATTNPRAVNTSVSTLLHGSGTWYLALKREAFQWIMLDLNVMLRLWGHSEWLDETVIAQMNTRRQVHTLWNLGKEIIRSLTSKNKLRCLWCSFYLLQKPNEFFKNKVEICRPFWKRSAQRSVERSFLN